MAFYKFNGTQMQAREWTVLFLVLFGCLTPISMSSHGNTHILSSRLYLAFFIFSFSAYSDVYLCTNAWNATNYLSTLVGDDQIGSSVGRHLLEEERAGSDKIYIPKLCI
jgi:hypothetical protein